MRGLLTTPDGFWIIENLLPLFLSLGSEWQRKWKFPCHLTTDIFLSIGGYRKTIFCKKKTACLSKRWRNRSVCNGLALRSGITTLGRNELGIWKRSGGRTALLTSNTVSVLERSWIWCPLHSLPPHSIWAWEYAIFSNSSENCWKIWLAGDFPSLQRKFARKFNSHDGVGKHDPILPSDKGIIKAWVKEDRFGTWGVWPSVACSQNGRTTLSGNLGGHCLGKQCNLLPIFRKRVNDSFTPFSLVGGTSPNPFDNFFKIGCAPGGAYFFRWGYFGWSFCSSLHTIRAIFS